MANSTDALTPLESMLADSKRYALKRQIEGLLVKLQVHFDGCGESHGLGLWENECREGYALERRIFDLENKSGSRQHRV